MGTALIGKRRVLVTSAAMLGAIAVMHAPWAALAKKGKDPVKASRKCRGAIGTWGSKAVSAGLGALDACHKLRDAGKFNGDCNVLTNNPKLAAAATRGTAVINHACTASDPVVQNYPDGKITDAMFPGIEQALEGSGTAVQGSPSVVGNKSSVKCHAAIGKARSGIVREVVKRSVACQRKADKSASTFGAITSACLAAPGRSADKARTLIAKGCGGASGADVGSCAGLPDCLVSEATTTGQVLARDIYGASASERDLLCGDGAVELGEECDDGNKVATDACTDHCKNAVCNDGIVEAGVEECDNDVRDPVSGALPPGSNENGCTDLCKLGTCGDEVIEPGEDCDDAVDAGCKGCKDVPVTCGSGSKGLKVEVLLQYPETISSQHVLAVNAFVEYQPSRVTMPLGDPNDVTILPLDDRYKDVQVVEIPTLATDRPASLVGILPHDPPVTPGDRLIMYQYGRLSVSMGVERGALVDFFFDCMPGDVLIGHRDFTCTAVLMDEAGTVIAGGKCRPVLTTEGPVVTTSTTPSTSSTSSSITTTTTTSSTTSTMPGVTTSTSTSVTTTSSTSRTIVCGDHTVTPGETCDDGNTVDETTSGYDPLPPDFCPATCFVGSCTPSGSTVSFDVNFSSPLPLGGVKVFVDYPDGRVAIPGLGNDPSVTARISHIAIASGVGGVPNDLDYGLIEVLGAAVGSSIPSPRLFTVSLDTCAGAPALTAADFGCYVKNASDTDGNDLGGVTCTVVPPAP